MIKKILIVEDSKVAIMMIKRIIEKLGFEVVGEAQNGQVALEAYKELNPDLVITDLEMPVLDGIEMSKEILDYNSNAKIIIITSVVNAQLIQKIVAIGITNILKKPITSEQLEKTILKII